LTLPKENPMSAMCLARTSAAIVLAIGAASVAHADSFNARPGAWEMTTTTVTSGMPIPAEQLAQMKPEQRAKVEATMKARSGQPRSHTSQSCLTQKDLDQNRILKSEDEGESKCTRKIVSKTPTKLVMEQACPAPHASTSTMTMESKSPEMMVASIDMVQGGSFGKVHVDISGRWLRASCAGIKD
jgi:hypothetical protein